MKIYLDVCCLNRPFDDQTQDRIHLESEAILTILKYVEAGVWDLINSDAIAYEISKIPDNERRRKVHLMISKANIKQKSDTSIKLRAKEIQKLGINAYDSFHVASAEFGKADIFLSTDDKLLNKLKKYAGKINIKTANPLAWIKEVI
jgi:hypothetical protein